MYQKPGVTISQVQRSATPILTAPDLEGVVVGNVYWWQDPTWDNPTDPLHHSIAPEKFTDNGSPKTVALSGINNTYYEVSVADAPLTVVDLFGVSGPDAGVFKHLSYGDDFSVLNNSITLSGVTTPAAGASEYLIKVGYRAKKTDAEKLNKILTGTEIADLLGGAVSWNPLAFGTQVAINNSATSFYALGIASDGSAINSINAVLGTKDVYAIAPVTHNNITAGGLKAHCETYSLPANKKERIGFVNNVVTYSAEPSTLSAVDRETLAAGIRDGNSAIGSKRLFSVHPDRGYVYETRHITTIKPSWINLSFDNFTSINFSTYGPYAKFASDVTLNGKRYKLGQDITETIWSELVAAGFGGASGLVDVYAPVPGFYFNAQNAGQVVGTTPEQPLTNVAGTGMIKTYGSQDLFTEAELNIMAAGGTYIMTQDSEYGPIYSRHQMSTDITSVAKRELSITKALDFTSKFLRNALKPYIGKYNITPAFLKLVNTILVGSALFLIRQLGVVNDIKIKSVTQDSIQPDTINVELEVLPMYPVNYIKVTLVF